MVKNKKKFSQHTSSCKGALQLKPNDEVHQTEIKKEDTIEKKLNYIRTVLATTLRHKRSFSSPAILVGSSNIKTGKKILETQHLYSKKKPNASTENKEEGESIANIQTSSDISSRFVTTNTNTFFGRSLEDRYALAAVVLKATITATCRNLLSWNASPELAEKLMYAALDGVFEAVLDDNNSSELTRTK